MLVMKKQAGISLIELMIAITLGLLLTAGAISFYAKTLDTQNDNIQLMRLNHDMRALMSIMVDDIRRSGFATTAPDNNFDCVKSNPFNKLGLFTTNTATAASPASCIVFAYNIDDDLAGNVCTIEDSDRFGFRFSNGALQMKRSGGTEATCANGTGTWETISVSDTTMTGSFSLSESELDITEMLSDADSICSTGENCNGCTSGNQCLTIREITITLTGTLVDGTSQTITEQVRIRNDEFDEIH
jgi:type IV pilus assembly protein PilW